MDAHRPPPPDPAVLAELSRRIEALRAEIERLAAGRPGPEAPPSAEAGADPAAGQPRAAELQARLDAALAVADRLARDRPALAMGLAAGLGFLLGLLLDRR